jgi:CelD/BcsL family acetyltransferase involved in cellulose biosynthesis
MPSVLEINDPSQLDDHRLLWSALLAQTPGATFFQSLDWLETYWRHFGPGQRLRVLIVSAGGGPVGILPLVVRTDCTRIGPVRALTYPLDDWGSFFGPIGPNPTATLLVGVEHVLATERDWDLLDFRWVDPEHDRGRTQSAMRAAGLRPGKQAWDHTAVVKTCGTWDEYWNSRQVKWRNNVCRLRRRLAEQGKVTYVRYRPEGRAYGDGDPRWDLYDACVELAEESWQGSSTDGTTLSHASIRSFLRDMHRDAAKAGAADVNLLLVDGRPVAFEYNYVYRGSVFGLRKGFDPAWRAFGPGTVLQYLSLEDSFRRGDRLYDLGPGSPDCKRAWETGTMTSYRYTHYPAAVARAQVLRLKHWLTGRFFERGNRATAHSA